MTINTKKNGTEVDIGIVGRLDTTTAPELEAELSAECDADAVVVDIYGLE